MKENILFTIAGLVLGFFVGFFMANSTGAGRQPPPGAPAATDSARLPPGHPDVNGDGGAGSAASSSAQAQRAMDAADRNPKDFAAQVRAAAVFYQLSSY